MSLKLIQDEILSIDIRLSTPSPTAPVSAYLQVRNASFARVRLLKVVHCRPRWMHPDWKESQVRDFSVTCGFRIHNLPPQSYRPYMDR